MIIQNDFPLREQSSRNTKLGHLVLLYSIIFLFIALLIYLAFRNSDKAPFHLTDGLLLYYPTLAYIGEYVRNIFYNIFYNHKLVVPFFEYCLGLGDDIFILLWEGLLNPFVLLVFTFASIKNTELFYWLFCFLQLYVGGIFFILYFTRKTIGNIPVLCGAIVYISSSFALTQFLMNYMFTTALILTPLVFRAVDEVVDNSKFYLLSLTIMFSFYINFYFTYMISIFALLYGILYACEVYYAKGAVKVVKVIGQGIKGYMLGIMLAAPVLLPTIYKYAGLSRKLDIAPITGDIFIYGWKALLYRIASLFAPGTVTSTNVIPICLLAAALLFCKKKKYVNMKIFLLLACSGLFFPFIGYILAAGSYFNERWSFILSFVFSLILTYTFDDLANIFDNNKKTYTVIISVILAYLFVIIIMRVAENSVYLKPNLIFSLMMLLLTATVLTFSGSLSINVKRLMLFCLCLICVFAQIYFSFYSANAVKFLSKFMPKGKSFDIIMQTASNTLDKIEFPDNEHFFRSDTSVAPYQTRGSSVLSKHYGISGYRSMISPIFTSYLFELENNGAWHMWQFHGFDERAFQLSLASVKYFAIENTYSKAHTPYGFKEIYRDGCYNVFINDYMLPLGYTYESYILKDTYDKFDPLKKQEAQLQAVALEKEVALQNMDESLIFLRRQIPFALEYGDGITFENGVIKITKENAAISVNFVSENNSEIYLRLCGLNISELSTYSLIILGIDYKGMNKTSLITSNRASIYTGHENHMINLGYHHNEDSGSLQKCIIKWPKKGAFKLDDIQLYAQPMDNYPAQINKLREDVLENIYVGNDRVSGTISLKKNKILCLSIPYSKGWHAKVDGKKAELLKANSLFMALPLEAGDHKIELEYRVPGLRLGLCFFALGLLLLLGIFLYDRKRRVSPQKENFAAAD